MSIGRGSAVIVTRRSAILLMTMMLVASLCAWLCAPVNAATTIGSDLSGTPAGVPSCGPNTCTFWQAALPGRMTTSPLNGVVVRWRLKAGMFRAGTSAAIRLRVVHPVGGGQVSMRGASQEVTIADQAIKIRDYTTRLPISAGDSIGVDCCADSDLQLMSYQADASQSYLNPTDESNSGPAQTPRGPNASQSFLNADIEADVDDDGYGDESQDRFPGNGAEWSDLDNDGVGDNADTDDDGDARSDSSDNCPRVANADQMDTDADGQGDVCDGDDDNDGVLDGRDACPTTSGPSNGCPLPPTPTPTPTPTPAPTPTATPMPPAPSPTPVPPESSELCVAVNRACTEDSSGVRKLSDALARRAAERRAREVARGVPGTRRSGVRTCERRSATARRCVIYLDSNDGITCTQSVNVLLKSGELFVEYVRGSTKCQRKGHVTPTTRNSLSLKDAEVLSRPAMRDLYADIEDATGYRLDSCRRRSSRVVDCDWLLEVDNGDIECTATVRVAFRPRTRPPYSARFVGKSDCYRS